MLSPLTLFTALQLTLILLNSRGILMKIFFCYFNVMFASMIWINSSFAQGGGLNEVLGVLLLACKYNKPVWPHAGGVGLCEYVQHIAMIDYLVISCEKDAKRIEYVDHLHEHFINPCIIKEGKYLAPLEPGFSIQMKSETLNNFLHLK